MTSRNRAQEMPHTTPVQSALWWDSSPRCVFHVAKQKNGAGQAPFSHFGFRS
jgi:hypothetical protein